MPDSFTTLTEQEFDQRLIENKAGVRVSVLANGCLQWITVGPTMVNLFVGSPLGGGPMRLLLRKHDEGQVTHTQAVGPESTADVAASEHAIRWSGAWDGLSYTVELILHATQPAWAWRVTLDTNGHEAAVGTYDAILVQDVGLADRGQIQNNEAYTSQYLDHQIFDHDQFGPVIATRQNLAQHSGQHPQLLTACTPGAAGALTDAFDFFGPATRAGHAPLHAATPTLPTRNRQYEFSCHVLQARAIALVADEAATLNFVMLFQADQSSASSANDLTALDRVFGSRGFVTHSGYFVPLSRSVAAEVETQLLNGEPLDDAQMAEGFGPPESWRQSVPSRRVVRGCGSVWRAVT